MRAHHDRACRVWPVPWWVGWHGEGRLKRAARRHLEAGGRIRPPRG